MNILLPGTGVETGTNDYWFILARESKNENCLTLLFEEKLSFWANYSECCKETVVTSLPWYIVFFSPEPAQQCQLVLSSFGLFTFLLFSLSFSFHLYFLFIVIFFQILGSVISLISFTFHFHFFTVLFYTLFLSSHFHFISHSFSFLLVLISFHSHFLCTFISCLFTFPFFSFSFSGSGHF